MEAILREILSNQKVLNNKLDAVLSAKKVLSQECEHVNVHAAKELLNRGRTWINSRMLLPEKVQPNMNTSLFLIKGIDYHREGRILMFNRKSLLRLKSEMKRIGEVYESKLQAAS